MKIQYIKLAVLLAASHLGADVTPPKAVAPIEIKGETVVTVLSKEESVKTANVNEAKPLPPAYPRDAVFKVQTDITDDPDGTSVSVTDTNGIKHCIIKDRLGEILFEGGWQDLAMYEYEKTYYFVDFVDDIPPKDIDDSAWWFNQFKIRSEFQGFVLDIGIESEQDTLKSCKVLLDNCRKIKEELRIIKRKLMSRNIKTLEEKVSILNSYKKALWKLEASRVASRNVSTWGVMDFFWVGPEGRVLRELKEQVNAQKFDFVRLIKYQYDDIYKDLDTAMDCADALTKCLDEVKRLAQLPQLPR